MVAGIRPAHRAAYTWVRTLLTVPHPEGPWMQDQVLGSPMPVLSISLEPGESVLAEAGEFAWMTDSIQLSTGVGGSPLRLSTYSALGAAGTIAFAAKLPGSIQPVDVAPGTEVLVHRHGFLAGTPGIEVSPGFQQSFAAGVFAAEGFLLRRIGGQGRAWVELAGQVVSCPLRAGQSLRAHPGHVGLLDSSVTVQVMPVHGVVNRYFADDVHYFAVLSGPGTVWLQSTPLPVSAAALDPYLNSSHLSAQGKP
jgi:uncharacterized protein (AIM24 family)